MSLPFDEYKEIRTTSRTAVKIKEMRVHIGRSQNVNFELSDCPHDI